MTTLGSDTFTILRAPLIPDWDGSNTRDWENATEIVVEGVMVEPFPMAEKLNFEEDRDREFTRTAFRFYCPPDTVLYSSDRLLWNGLELDVFGEPGPWKRFNGKIHHIAFIGRVRAG